jgi:ABC-type transport system involved in cytochrome c biogenesis permease subunit
MLAAGVEAHPWVATVGALNAAALLGSAPGLLLRRRTWVRLGLALLAAAFVINTLVLVNRWIDGGRPPFKTLFETLIFYPWCTAVVTLTLIALRRLTVLIPFAGGISAFGIAYALYRPDVELVLMPPALQSGWFVPHVVTYFVSYAGLFASFALALVALFTKPKPDGSGTDWFAQAHGAAVFGVVALTAGLVMGAVWGKYAWGDYWGWDPKENWALVTWLAYMVYLHLRLMEGWQGKRAMVLLIASFAAVVFTYLGMNLLPTADGSLHVYQ